MCVLNIYINNTETDSVTSLPCDLDRLAGVLSPSGIRGDGGVPLASQRGGLAVLVDRQERCRGRDARVG